MERADLPTDTAQEPAEEAYQPQKENMSTHGGIQLPEISSSQNTPCKSIIPLSQSESGLSHRQRLLMNQKLRGPGLWAQCDDCDKWRFLAHVVDSHELPDKWYCRLNPDRSVASCSIDETPLRLREEEDLIHSEYSAGSVVWARLTGWPWWPAMIDDCPDTEQFYWIDGFSDIPTHYNVTFFDEREVTRAWISSENIKPFGANKKALKHEYIIGKNRRYKKRLSAAFKQADDADMLPLANRLAKYSFISRYRGTIKSPKKITKLELKIHKNKLKRRLDIDFSGESDCDENAREATSNKKRLAMQNKNIILLGTPKAKKKKRTSNIELNGTTNVTQKSLTENVSENSPLQPTDGVLKEADSMTVHIGSTLVNTDTMPIDNDSSKTYLPESEVRRLRTADADQPDTEFHVRIATPSSDDFEF